MVHPISQIVASHDEFTGHIAAIDSVVIRARVSGYLAKVNFIDGQEVTKGDLLFQIDPRPYQAEVDRTQAELQKSQSVLDLSNKDFERATGLFASKAISTEEYDTRRQSKDQAEAAVKSAQAALETAQLNLSYTQVIAPISGKISRRLMTEGNLVTGDVTDLTTLVSVDPVYAYVDVDEATVIRYQKVIKTAKQKEPGYLVPCGLSIADERDFSRLGHLDFVDNMFNSATGTLSVRGVFDNRDRRLIPGQFVRIRVDGSPAYQAVLVPAGAIQRSQDVRSVLAVDAEGKLVSKIVDVGPAIGNLQVIKSGISPTDAIVEDVGILRPGTVIKPKQETLTASPEVMNEAAPLTEVKPEQQTLSSAQ